MVYGIKRVSFSFATVIQRTCDITPRIRECSISVCHESRRRLHCALCGPGYVCPVLWSTSSETDFPSFFQWQDILQVIISRTSALALANPGSGEVRGQDEGLTTCPICLSSPVAPRMTKCGHVSPTAPFPNPWLIMFIGILLPLYLALPKRFGHCQMGALSDMLRLDQREAAQERQVVRSPDGR